MTTNPATPAPVQLVTAQAIYLDGTTDEAPVGARAQVEVERRYGIAYSDLFKQGEKAPYERIYCLVWASLRFAGKVLPDVEFDAWLETVGDADLVPPKADEPARPTKRARRPETSSH